MNRELLLAGVLLSISTVLKICSIIALCQSPAHLDELEHHLQPLSKKSYQSTHLRV